MNLNPLHHDFLLTKYARDKLHAGKSRILLQSKADNIIGVAHYANQHSYLHQLCQKYGTDKGHTDIAAHNFGKGRGHTHDYASVYDLLFATGRQHIKNVLECGIATLDRRDGINPKDHQQSALGPSLRMWREYFPNATITGIDIDEHCLFADERIDTYQCDQTDQQSIQQFLQQIPERKFDIVIDDGLHTFPAGKFLFENIIDRLTDDGVYIIEDVSTSRLHVYAEYFANSKYLVRFVMLPKIKTSSTQSLIVITKQRRQN